MTDRACPRCAGIGYWLTRGYWLWCHDCFGSGVAAGPDVVSTATLTRHQSDAGHIDSRPERSGELARASTPLADRATSAADSDPLVGFADGSGGPSELAAAPSAGGQGQLRGTTHVQRPVSPSGSESRIRDSRERPAIRPDRFDLAAAYFGAMARRAA